MDLSRTMEYVRFRLIGSRLERPARALRRLRTKRTLMRTPELAECLTEDRVIDSVLGRFIVDGMHCVDVGAHLGAMLSRFDQLSPHGHHTAFEPLEHKAHWVRDRYPQHTIHASAVSDRAGSVEFVFQPHCSGYSGMKLHDAGQQDVEHRECLRVPACRLDDVIPASQTISFLKVDVEGAEMQVFNGAANLIRRDRPMILFECARSALKPFEIEPTQVFDQLSQRFGYEIFAPADLSKGLPALSRSAFDAATQYPFRAFNFFALPRVQEPAQARAA